MMETTFMHASMRPPMLMVALTSHGTRRTPGTPPGSISPARRKAQVEQAVAFRHQ